MTARTVLRVGAWACALALLAVSAVGVGISPRALIVGAKNIVVYLQDYFPPKFGQLPLYFEQAWLTLEMAIWGTVLAIVPGVPLAVLASRNFAPNAFVYQLSRRILDLLRSINEMVFALIFVVAVGLGAFAGVLALAVHTVGVFGKQLAEAVESIDPGPVEAVRASGAGELHVFVYAIWPQVLPHAVAYGLLRFETNVRSATVVGLTGAGGLGFYLWDAMRSFQSQEVCTMLIMILAMVSITDFLSSRLRAQII